ncbi:MAG: AbrB/MazE/SpoVT family DNA-binding domain-containing protein [Desulfocucumaceae bacterium]
MIKTLTSHGNSAALVIDKAILELLGISITTPLKITTDGKSLIVSPLPHKQRDGNFKVALNKVNAHHGATLKKLSE